MSFNVLGPSPLELLMGMGGFANTSAESLNTSTMIDARNRTDKAESSASARACMSSGGSKTSATSTAKLTRNQSGRFSLIETQQASHPRTRAHTDTTLETLVTPKTVVKRAVPPPLQLQIRQRAGSLPQVSPTTLAKGFGGTLTHAVTNIKNRLILNHHDPSIHISPPTPTSANGFNRFEVSTTYPQRTFISLANAQARRASPDSTCRLQDLAPQKPVGHPIVRNVLTGELLLAPPPPKSAGEGQIRLVLSPGRTPRLVKSARLPAQAHSATIHTVGDMGSDIDFSEVGSQSKRSPIRRDFSFCQGDDRLMPEHASGTRFRNAKCEQEANRHYDASFNRSASREFA